MTIREKLLLKLAQDPSYAGVDETEKALVSELKAEMKSNEVSASPQVSAEVREAAGVLTSQIGELVKALTEQQKAVQSNVERSAVITDEAALSAEKVKEMSTAERFSEFVKSLYRNDNVRAKALAEGVDADGGYLVPDDFRAQLIEHMNSAQAFRSFCTVIPTTSKYLELPKLTSDVQVTWGTENQAIATTTADFGNVTLTPFRMNAIIYTSRELFDDSSISIMDILMRRFRDRVADEENKVFINGSGTGRPKGVATYTYRSVAAANSLTPDHLTKAYYKLPETYRNTARWLINSRVMEHLENSKDSNGAYLYPSLQGDVKTLKGRPVIVNDYQPSTSILFGDFTHYLIADRQQMSMEVTTEAGDTWKKHQVGLKVTERVDGRLGLSEGIVAITGTNIH